MTAPATRSGQVIQMRPLPTQEPVRPFDPVYRFPCNPTFICLALVSVAFWLLLAWAILSYL